MGPEHRVTSSEVQREGSRVMTSSTSSERVNDDTAATTTELDEPSDPTSFEYEICSSGAAAFHVGLVIGAATLVAFLAPIWAVRLGAMVIAVGMALLGLGSFLRRSGRPG